MKKCILALNNTCRANYTSRLKGGSVLKFWTHLSAQNIRWPADRNDWLFVVKWQKSSEQKAICAFAVNRWIARFSNEIRCLKKTDVSVDVHGDRNQWTTSGRHRLVRCERNCFPPPIDCVCRCPSFKLQVSFEYNLEWFGNNRRPLIFTRKKAAKLISCKYRLISFVCKWN